MPTITWPTDVPTGVSAQGYDEALPDLTVRTPMDSGVAKVRAIDTDNAQVIPCVIPRVTAAQVASFENFFVDDLAGGAVEFVRPHPRKGTAVLCRIMGGDDRPRLRPRVQGVSWDILLTLEILPQ